MDLEWPEAGYRSAPYRVYHDPEIYEREQRRIFRGPVWHFVALEAELPEAGDFKRSFIGDTPVVVTRDADGRLCGFVKRCAHRGSLVCHEHAGKKRQGFTCVYHAWSYDLAGNLTNAAFRRGIRGEGGLPADFDPAAHGPQKLRVDSLAGIVFATMSDAAAPLADYVGATVAAGMHRTMNRPICVLGYDTQIINANWKTYAENTRDTFHANILHTFFGTFGVSRQSQESAAIVDPRGLHYYTYTRRGTERPSAASPMSTSPARPGSCRWRTARCANSSATARAAAARRPPTWRWAARTLPAASPRSCRRIRCAASGTPIGG
jgi:phenylpropionate dioxygenase-like ring-hydroxylating dioxygenase large terminal subunit